MGIRILHVDRDYVKIPLVPGGDARAVVWPGMGAKNAGLHYVIMKPGQENVPHVHSLSEDIIYVIQGEGMAVDFDSGTEHPFTKGSVIYVSPGTNHTIRATGKEDYIVVGTLAPADTEMYIRAGIKW
jgi:quercetin dioxygenase-like cupin family protein